MKNYEHECSTLELSDCLLSVFTVLPIPDHFVQWLNDLRKPWFVVKSWDRSENRTVKKNRTKPRKTHFILVQTKKKTKKQTKGLSLCEYTLSVGVPTWLPFVLCTIEYLI